MKNFVVAAVLIVATAGQASAQRAFYAMGDANIKCGEYLQARERRQNFDGLTSWTLGYITAYNQWSPSPSIDTFPERSTVIAYFDKYCRDNPLDSLITGVGQMISDLGGHSFAPRDKR